jgi:predicted amidohydrolase YtcJ
MGPIGKSQKSLTPDLILTNANVVTLDPSMPHAEMVAIRNGRIQFIGKSTDLGGATTAGTKVIDCHGKTLLPGLIDAHFHLLGFAESLVTLSLEPRNNVRSIADIQAKIGQLTQTLPPGTWIRGWGYDEFYLVEKRHPTRWDLDKVAPFHPVKMIHRSGGRVQVLNSLGLKLVGITKETEDPSEGVIDRDLQTGEPTGILYGLGDYLARAVPPLGYDQIESGIKLASQRLASLGITSIQDASSRNNLRRWKMFREWNERGCFKPRITMILGREGFEEYRNHPFETSIEEDHLRITGVKIVLHETTGRLSPNESELNERVFQIHQAGLQAVLHAIEEKTIEAACRAIEYALDRSPGREHRHRIEHCSVCPPTLARRLASLGIVVVTQPSFIYYNGDRYLEKVTSERLNHLYPIATLVGNGIEVAGSSDCPIVPANPFVGIYSAVSRATETGQIVLAEQKVSIFEALGMYTGYAAQAAFEETRKGSIIAGKLADLMVVNGDPTRLTPDETRELEVEMTIIDGKVIWNRMD